MKFLNIINISLGAITATTMLLSCAKTNPEMINKTDQDFSNKARVQIYDASMGTAKNYVYIDGGASSGAVFAYPSTYPATPANFALAAGMRQFVIKDTTPSSTQPQMAFAENFQAGAFYTIFMYDTVTVIKHKTVQNNIVVPDDTTARIRFASFAYSPNAMPALDVFSFNKNAVIFSNVGSTDVTNFIPFESNKTDTLYLMLAGTGTYLNNRTVAGSPAVTIFTPIKLAINPTNKRSYTVIFRGSYRTDLTTAGTNLRQMSLFSSY